MGRAKSLVGVRNLVTPRVNDTFLVFEMDYVWGEPRPDRQEVSEATFLPLSELVSSSESAPFTKAVVERATGAAGLRLDPYQPPDDRLGHEAYLLYLDGGKGL